MTAHTCGDSNRDPGTCPACACIRQPSGSSYRRAYEVMARRESGDRLLMRFYHDVRVLGAEVVDCGFDDLDELRFKLDGIIAACSELRKHAERIADDQAERMSEPHDSGWVSDFNRGKR